MQWWTKHIQVNVPFGMLHDEYLERFAGGGLNPEIGFGAEALDRFRMSDYRSVAERLHAAGLSITCHGPFMDLSPAGRDPLIRDVTRRRFEQVLEVLPIFQPLSLVCHAGYDRRRYGFMKGEWLEKSADTWSWLAERLADSGVRLMLENVYEDGPGDLIALFERLSGLGVGFCLDTGHQAAFGQAPLTAWLETLGPFLGQMHLHDNCGGGDDHLALGRGSIDFDPLFEYLDSRSEELPILTLEPHQEADLQPSLDYLSRVWRWKGRAR